ncbi:MAG: S8 family serine peptidase [Thermodesulfovibrionia bacterium]|nr:S8 family serine peptidase [Thermodesulfovibrionia bacterium]
MKTQFLTKVTTVIMGLFLCLPVAAIAKEKSFIVGFHEKPGHFEKALIHEARGIIKRTYRLIPAMAVTVSEAGVEKIKKNKKVAYVEEDAIYMAVEPLIGDEYINSWGVFHIFADVAHTSGNKGAGVKVAVIDTGIDYNHPDLDGNFKGGYDFVFNDDDPFDDNSNSHGTHVAGIIAAEENGIGVIGVAPEADLYAVKVLDGAGFGYLSWIIDGIQWAVNNGMDIVNLSLQGPHAQSLQIACNNAYSAGVLLVAAGGNTYGGSIMFPAAYDSVIAVTATDADDLKAYFSPIGPEVELAAPGVDILSTCSLINNDCVGGYRSLSGTSQASPHVAGTAALLLSTGISDENGNGRINDEVREILQDTALALGAAEKNNVFGFGLVNAASASFTADVSFTILRNHGSPHLDAEAVHLSGLPYEITIENNGLTKVDVDVFEDGTFLKDLSTKYHFGDKKPQDITFSIDATGKRYDVTFTPYRKSGSSADITISVK